MILQYFLDLTVYKSISSTVCSVRPPVRYNSQLSERLSSFGPLALISFLALFLEIPHP